jgi:hypothetical protein
MGPSLSNIQVTGADGKATYYNGASSGITALGNATVHNVPVGDGTVYNGVASGYQQAAPNAAAPQSPGVQQTTTQLRQTATSNAASLTGTLANLGSANAQKAQQQSQGLYVANDLDNGDGTHSITMSDGSTSKVNVTQNADGTTTRSPIQQPDPNVDPNSAEGQISSAKATAQKQIDHANTTLDGIQSTADSATQALISSIKQIYGARITQMEDSNSRVLAGKTQAGIVNGTARYATDVQNGVLTDEEQQGIMRVGQLQGEMLQEIAKAQQAQNEENLTVFNDRMDKVNAIQTDLNKQVADIHQQALDAQSANMKAQLDAASLEKTQLENTQTKADSLAPALADSLAGVEPDQQSAWLKAYAEGMGIPVGTLIGSLDKYQQGQKKAALDLRNIESQITSRDVSTQKTRQDIKNGGSGGSNALSATQKQTLLGVGFTAEEITSIANDANTSSIDKVLSDPGLTADQKAAIEKVYAVPQKVSKADISSQVDTAIAKGDVKPSDVLKNNYTADELNQMARDAGFGNGFLWFGTGQEGVDKFLASAKGKEVAKKIYSDILYKQYTDAGMTSD